MNGTCQKILTGLGVIGFLLLGSTVVHADPFDFYFGIGTGVADFDGKAGHGEDGAIHLDSSDTTYKIFGGYQATENFAVEGTYRDFGEVQEGLFSTETDGLDIGAVGMFLMGPVDVFARGGVIFWDTKGRGGLPDGDGKDLSWGFGGALKMGNTWVRVESEWFDVEVPSDFQTVTASVAWSF